MHREGMLPSTARACRQVLVAAKSVLATQGNLRSTSPHVTSGTEKAAPFQRNGHARQKAKTRCVTRYRAVAVNIRKPHERAYRSSPTVCNF